MKNKETTQSQEVEVTEEQKALLDRIDQLSPLAQTAAFAMLSAAEVKPELGKLIKAKLWCHAQGPALLLDDDTPQGWWIRFWSEIRREKAEAKTEPQSDETDADEEAELADEEDIDEQRASDPDYVPDRAETLHYAHPKQNWKNTYRRIKRIFLEATPRERLLLWMLWELQTASGHTTLDFANDMMRGLSEDFDMAEDPDSNWLLGAYQMTELLNAH